MADLSSIRPKLYECNYLQCPENLYRKIIAPMPYFLYVHKGTGRFIIGKKEYICKEGDLFFCPYHVQNIIIADSKDPFLLSGIDFEFFEHCPDFTPPEEFKDYININNHPQFLWLLLEIITRKQTIDENFTYYTDALFKAWLLLVANISTTPLKISLAETLSRYISAHLEEKLSLACLGEIFKYHPNHINRVFKNRYGMPIKTYIETLRMKKAMHLLSYTDMNISEIALLCGFEDFNFFSRQFNKKTGLPPTQYRKKIGRQ